ncbi:hypothetical protein WJX73_008058 [Symbiochloris irregularis]|uniref:RNA helicase n=1 Tax=Symbiochloris irregularis TaxID=706552 RepID=A0AAW1PNC5_9CHLO
MLRRSLAAAGKPIRKRLYTQTASLSEAEVESWRQERSITVDDCSLNPVLQFEQAGFPADVLLSTEQFVAPSPIQAQCWPVVLSGRDVVGIAATGSGKTLAFGLPAICHTLAQPGGPDKSPNQPQVLIVAPTRELVQQIADVMCEAAGHCALGCIAVFGGSSRKQQVRLLRNGLVHIVVATPGRLQDLVADGSCRLDKVTYLVLDEADRMLDLGFEPAIRAIAGGIRADRQTLMFSATWPASIQRLAMDFLCNAARVTIGSKDLSASHSIAQVVEVMEQGQRDGRLEALLQKHGGSKQRILVFVLYKKEAARVEGQLLRKGWKVAAIHGDLSQDKRTAAINAFRDGSVPLLVATDVAARGLDIPDVALVLNFSFPLTVEDYCHRIGRTGRAGKTGLAHTFFCPASDRQRAGELINVLREAGQPVPEKLLQFGTTVKKKESKLYGAHFKDIDPLQKSSKVTFDF